MCTIGADEVVVRHLDLWRSSSNTQRVRLRCLAGDTTLKPSLVRAVIGTSQLVVEEELDIWSALKLVEQSVVESTPINCINCLQPSSQPCKPVQPTRHARCNMQVKVKYILGHGRHRPVRPPTAVRALGRGSSAHTWESSRAAHHRLNWADATAGSKQYRAQREPN